MASESLSAHSFSDVPELGRSIAGSRDKHPGVRCQRQTHHITCVTSKRGCLLTGLNVPQSTAKQSETQLHLNWNTHQHLRHLGYSMPRQETKQSLQQYSYESVETQSFTFSTEVFFESCLEELFHERLFVWFAVCLHLALPATVP